MLESLNLNSLIVPETRMKVHLLLRNFKLREEDAIVEFELILEIVLVEGAGKSFRVFVCLQR